ncbi:LamG domain-containing protein, partial [Verrucomicrobia bacterium]|nr:LamG domain-containing protein [Verrucomicrobiota bacterium]
MASTLLGSTLFVSAQPEWINDGLVAHYPFNGDANDASGNDNHLRNVGSILIENRFGSNNSAVSFSGDSYLWAPDSMLPAKNSPRSISIWVKADGDLNKLRDVSTGRLISTGLIMSYGNLPVIDGNGGVWIELWNDPDSVFGIRYVSKSFDTFLHSEFPEKREDWHHICYTFDGRTLRCFYNGEFVNSRKSSGFHSERESRLFLGGGPGAEGRGLAGGSLDDVRIYDRSLSAVEVEELYVFESKLPPIEEWIGDGLVAHYKFDGDAVDSSKNNANSRARRPKWVTDRFGVEESAFYTSEDLNNEMRANGNNLPLGSSPRTISMWIKPETKTVTQRGDILGYGLIDGNEGSVIALFHWFSDSRGVNRIAFGSDEFDWHQDLLGWSFDEWHHVVWTYSGGNSADIYVDGVLLPETIGHIPGKIVSELSMNTVAGPLVVGHFTANRYDGAIDDLRIYDKVLSSKEVLSLYEVERTRNGPSNSPA